MEAENGQSSQEETTMQSQLNGESPAVSQHEVADISNKVMTLLQNMWDSYRYHVLRHQFSLHLADDVLTRAIFWTPTTSASQNAMSSRRRWREVAYGLLSLHRMAMDLALTHDQVIDSYGTTLQPSLTPAIPATALRIALTITHNLMPTCLELARSSLQGQATCRLWLERVKFVIRLALVTSYWRQVRNNENQDVVAGLLQNGGMYHVGMEQPAPSVDNVQALKIRRQYVGRRTGRRVMSSGVGGSNEENQQEREDNRFSWSCLMFGELLRLYRPLYWAQAERNESISGSADQLWRDWVMIFAMEVVSLRCLSGVCSRDNPQSQAELSRRRMKILLYLLRSPIWDRYTEPGVARTAAAVRRVPVLGKLVETYLWEFILYWKHAFVSEEE